MSIIIKKVADFLDELHNKIVIDWRQELLQKYVIIIQGQETQLIDCTLFSHDVGIIFVMQGSSCELVDHGIQNVLYVIADYNSSIFYKKQPTSGGEFHRKLYAYDHALIKAQLHVVEISDYKLIWDQNLSASKALIEFKAGIVARNNNRVIIATNQFHHEDHTNSSVLIKGVAHDAASIAYHGLIDISKTAQYTVASQRSLFLFDGEQAMVTSNPTMNVLTGAVTCNHATAIGMLSQEEIFYLQARGLEKPRAEDLLLKGFFKEVNMTPI